jgi:hypothetical protein
MMSFVIPTEVEESLALFSPRRISRIVRDVSTPLDMTERGVMT